MTELINIQSLKPFSTAGSVQNNNKKIFETNQCGHIRKQKKEKSLEMIVEKLYRHSQKKNITHSQTHVFQSFLCPAQKTILIINEDI